MKRHLPEGPRTKDEGRRRPARAPGACTGLAVCCLVLCPLAPVLWPSPLRAADLPSYPPRRSAVVEVVQRVRAAVVNIHSERTVPPTGEAEALGASPSRVNGMGTGIIIDPRGYIVTNHHVIEDVSLLRVRLSDGTTASARVVARDAETDLALMKIDVNRSLPTMPIGTSSDVLVGETVIAIGNAFGYEHTVTVGVVSAIKRDVVLNKEMSYKQLIQTDASINPGNSGGPLLNVHGELIGVNVAIRAGAQGIGFAIPVDSMLRVAADMLSSRRRHGTWHGLIGRDEVTPAAELEPVAASPDGPRRRLVIDRLEAGSPAARAGLQRGDVVVRANDQAVACALDLERALLDARPGDKLPLVVRRKDGEQKLELVLGTAERTMPIGPELVWRKLGVRVQTAAAELVTRANPQLHGGVNVTEVRADSPAAKAGIQRGDILVGLHQWEMLTLDNVLFVLNHPDLASFSPLRFYIVRSGKIHQGHLHPAD